MSTSSRSNSSTSQVWSTGYRDSGSSKLAKTISPGGRPRATDLSSCTESGHECEWWAVRRASHLTNRSCQFGNPYSLSGNHISIPRQIICSSADPRSRPAPDSIEKTVRDLSEHVTTTATAVEQKTTMTSEMHPPKGPGLVPDGTLRPPHPA